jgi:hypothetical protein
MALGIQWGPWTREWLLYILSSLYTDSPLKVIFSVYIILQKIVSMLFLYCAHLRKKKTLLVAKNKVKFQLLASFLANWILLLRHVNYLAQKSGKCIKYFFYLYWYIRCPQQPNKHKITLKMISKNQLIHYGHCGNKTYIMQVILDNTKTIT